MDLKESHQGTTPLTCISLELLQNQKEPEQQFKKKHRRNVSLVQTGLDRKQCESN